MLEGGAGGCGWRVGLEGGYTDGNWKYMDAKRSEGNRGDYAVELDTSSIRAFYIWTFAYDVSGIDTVVFNYRIDSDGVNPIGSIANEIYNSGRHYTTNPSLLT